MDTSTPKTLEQRIADGEVKIRKHCYDFPELVVHTYCERYKGGVCVPKPTPTPPYTDEEASAIQSYLQWKYGMIPDSTTLRRIKATGITVMNGEIIE